LESTKHILDEIELKGFSVCDDFISTGETEIILSKIHSLLEQKQFKQAGIGNKNALQINAEIRKDSIFWVDKNDAEIHKIFFKKLDALVLELNRSFYLGINDHEFHLAHYPSGAFYKKHRDAFKSDDARRISVILYLNLNWKKEQGGELKIYSENGTDTSLQPIAGRIVIFESQLEHEVLESKADRFSITGWLKSKALAF
jgi:SM-20-related protein